MLHAVLRINERSGLKELFLVPSTDLEEKFLVWFSTSRRLERQKVNGRTSLRFPVENAPESLEANMQRAFEEFKKRYRYVEIPNVRGLTVAAAKEELRLHDLTWAIEREVESAEHPHGVVISQKPPAGAGVSITESVVYLEVSREKTPHTDPGRILFPDITS